MDVSSPLFDSERSEVRFVSVAAMAVVPIVAVGVGGSSLRLRETRALERTKRSAKLAILAKGCAAANFAKMLSVVDQLRANDAVDVEKKCVL